MLIKLPYVFLSMAPRLGTRTTLYKLGNLVPVFTVLEDSLPKPVVLLVGPSSFICHRTLLALPNTSRRLLSVLIIVTVFVHFLVIALY